MTQVLHPESEDDLVAMIKAAQGPILVRGGGTRGAFDDRMVLETGGLAGVSIYEPGALTLVVKTGTPLQTVEDLLASENQRLPFEPPRLARLLGREGHSTIGGVMATNASGPRRIASGAARDAMLGVRFVDGQGNLIRNGGRVMKNVTGYDLVKLLAGSRGRLGVMTEIAIKVQAVPETEITLTRAANLVDGAGFLRRALATPFDPTGAAWSQGRAYIRLEGLPGSVAYRGQAMRAALGGDWDIVENDQSARLWRDIRDGQSLQAGDGALWRIHCQATSAATLGAALGAQILVDWGGGALWCRVDPDLDVPALVRGHGVAQRLDARPDGADGAPSTLASLIRGVERAFDPKGIFGRGS